MSCRPLSLIASERIRWSVFDKHGSSVSSSSRFREEPSSLKAGRTFRGILLTAKKSRKTGELRTYSCSRGVTSTYRHIRSRVLLRTPKHGRFGLLGLYVRNDAKRSWGRKERQTGGRRLRREGPILLPQHQLQAKSEVMMALPHSMQKWREFWYVSWVGGDHVANKGLRSMVGPQEEPIPHPWGGYSTK